MSSPMTLEQVRDEVELVRAVLLGYPDSMAKSDALRALRVIDANLNAARGEEVVDGRPPRAWVEAAYARFLEINSGDKDKAQTDLGTWTIGVHAALKAAPVSEHTIDSISDRELISRVLRNIERRPGRKGLPLWSVVGQAFALGSTFSAQLCRRHGLDPDATKAPPR